MDTWNDIRSMKEEERANKMGREKFLEVKDKEKIYDGAVREVRVASALIFATSALEPLLDDNSLRRDLGQRDIRASVQILP